MFLLAASSLSDAGSPFGCFPASIQALAHIYARSIISGLLSTSAVVQEWVKVDANGARKKKKKKKKRREGGAQGESGKEGQAEGEEEEGLGAEEEEAEEVLLVVDIPPNSMGLIIGKQGTSIRGIRSACPR